MEHGIAPDAVFRIADHTFALEYDRGLENRRYFMGSKVAAYRRGLPGLPFAGLLIALDSESRHRTLARARGNCMNEIDIVRFFETGAMEKAEVVFNIVREKMRERIRDR